jgi:hypothetical protein
LKTFLINNFTVLKDTVKKDIEAPIGIPQIDRLTIGQKVGLFFMGFIVAATICYAVIFRVY